VSSLYPKTYTKESNTKKRGPLSYNTEEFPFERYGVVQWKMLFACKKEASHFNIAFLCVYFRIVSPEDGLFMGWNM
jgi:hypothetical protein